MAEADQAHRRNFLTAGAVLGVVFAMVAMSYAAVPLYKLFCQVTGWGGTTKRADAAPDLILDRMITVRFDATVDPRLPWRFRPEQISQSMRIGESRLAFYEAANLSTKPVVGRATFNVTPAKAGKYFKKIECFCFTEQMLAAGEQVTMPVSYFIDPAIADDRQLDEVETITLSYTFFDWGADDDAPPADAPAR